ncbi:MAG: hypothetical protein ACRCUM_03810 [Mycoplasmoidaceae bacterium]
MKKKVIISSLLIGSAISVLPLNFINRNFEEKNIDNENNDENEEISNIMNANTRGEYVGAFTGKNYASIFFNNYTNPVVSPNADIPGILGAWDVNTNGTFPTAIGWTSPDSFLSWSANLIDHPSLVGKVPTNFSPGLITALHSDNKYSTNKRNQVFAIVGNTLRLNDRRYWILRYNTLDGSPIKDDNPEMPIMPNAPLPVMNASNGNGSAFAIANDTINNRYIAFYPGRMGNLKNDIFGFNINSNNEITWLQNRAHFTGHSNWGSMTANSGRDYNDDNIVIGLSPFNTSRSVFDQSSLALMVAVNPPPSSNQDNYNFKILNLQHNLAGNVNFTPVAITGRNSSVFNSTQGIISPPKSLLSLQTIQRNVNPNLQFFTYIDEEGIPNNKVQMIVPVLRNDEWIYMYLGGIYNKFLNTYYNSWGIGGTIGQGGFFNSPSFDNTLAPYISYNEDNPNEILLVSHTTTSNPNRFTANKFIFDTKPINGPWSPQHTILVNRNNSGDNWAQKQMIIRTPHVQDSFIWSMPRGLTQSYFHESDNQLARLWSSYSHGGMVRTDFQITASRKQWLINQNNAKLPSQLTDSDLETIGTGSNNFFQIPSRTLPSGVTFSPSEIKLFGSPTRDDSRGIIQGIYTLKNRYSIYGRNYQFESKVPFKVTGLNISNDIPTSISQNNLITNFLPSDLTPLNIPNLMDVIAVPNAAVIQGWSISDQNNIDGTARISVNIRPHFDDTGTQVNEFKTITTDVSGLKTLTGTTGIQNSEDNSDLTVWDVIPSNVSNFVQINDLVPGSSDGDITYSIRDQEPLEGKLTIVASIRGGAYYDPSNKGLPSIAGNPPLEIPILITGFKKISDTGTRVLLRTGPFNGVYPGFINRDNIMEYITIDNEVPGTGYDITNIQTIDGTEDAFDGIVTFDITFEKTYETTGFINHNPPTISYQIDGFQGGPTPRYTTVVSTGNQELFSNTLALEINENNINQFIIVVNLPAGVTPVYEFRNQKNTGQANTGFQDVVITFSKYLDQFGVLVDAELKTDPIRINNLKTMPAATSVTPLSGENDMLPEFVSEFNLERYLRINNGSTITNRETSIQVITNNLTTNNINGSITFQYRLINAITDFGFIEQSNPILITVSGFQRGTFTAIEQISNFRNEKASEFNLNKDNFFSHAKIVGYYIPFDEDAEGNISGTIINRIEKISSDDTIGIATFKVFVEGGAINSQGKFTLDPIEINFTFDGFQIVKPQDNTIPIIAGAAAGGILLIIAIVALIIAITNRKNKKILSEKRKTTTPGAPPRNPGGNKSVPPSHPSTPLAPPTNTGVNKSLSPSQPSTPGATRSVPPPPPLRK